MLAFLFRAAAFATTTCKARRRGLRTTIVMKDVRLDHAALVDLRGRHHRFAILTLIAPIILIYRDVR
jgi:hypothetical protein